MKEILVIANQTLGGKPLIEQVLELAREPGVRFRVIVPQNRPQWGNVIYDEAVRHAAQVRLDLALSFLEQEGIEATGEVGDEDPFQAAMDAIAEHQPDEVIVSTLPATASGWLRRDLVERIHEASGLPVHHVVVDLDAQGLPFTVTLVVANQTSSGDELIDHLRAKAAAPSTHLFIVVIPQQSGHGQAPREARERLAATLDRLQAAGLMAAGLIGDPDPFTATMNALQFFRVDEVVISTFPATRSGWLRADLVERVRRATPAKVEHVVVDLEPANAAAG